MPEVLTRNSTTADIARVGGRDTRMTSLGSDSGSIEDRIVKLACTMTMADQMVWPRYICQMIGNTRIRLWSVLD